MIKCEYSLLVIKKERKTTKYFFFLLKTFLLCSSFLLFLLLLIYLLEKLCLFLHCKMQTEFTLFIKDEAEHIPAFLPIALLFSMTQMQSGPTLQRADPSRTNPQREITAFLLSNWPSGFYTFSLGFSWTVFFIGHFPLGQVCFFMPQRVMSISGLRNMLPIIPSNKCVMGGRDS